MFEIPKATIKKCLFLTFDEFNNLILNITDGLKCACYEYDGIYFDDTLKAEEINTYYNGDLYNDIGKCYEVEISSIHADDYSLTGVWICCKEN